MSEAACAVDDLAPGETLVVTLGGRAVTLVRDLEGAFHALDDACPHVGWPLHKGSVHPEAVIECSLHHGLWCLRTGEPRRYPARTPATVHTVEVRDGQVWVTLSA